MTTHAKQGGYLDLTAVIWREGEDFVSLCPELGVSSCGASLEEATAMLKEAVDLYLENARELDTSMRLSRVWPPSTAGPRRFGSRCDAPAPIALVTSGHRRTPKCRI